MKLLATKLDGLYLADSDLFRDERGSLARLFSAQELSQAIGGRQILQILQINHSHTLAKGTVRGLHFQHPPHAEMKMVRCLKGRVLDVAVDVRRSSPTFLHYHAEILSGENARMMIIPEGFAHGFQALEDDCEMLYLHTALYEKSAEGGLRADDPEIGIDWPLPVINLSPRDSAMPLVSAHDAGVDL